MFYPPQIYLCRICSSSLAMISSQARKLFAYLSERVRRRHRQRHRHTHTYTHLSCYACRLQTAITLDQGSHVPTPESYMAASPPLSSLSNKIHSLRGGNPLGGLSNRREWRRRARPKVTATNTVPSSSRGDPDV